MSKIALLPGGFKPPHAGHYNMAKWLSANTGADTTIIFVGPKERDGITQAMSLKLWKLYTQNDSGLEVRPAGVSPVRDVYDFIEQDAPEGSTVYLGMGEKDVNDTRFKNIPKFAEPRGITFETKLVPPQAGGVSGTEMRGFIKMNDKPLFQYSLPDHLSNEQKEQAWNIVTGLEEDFYDPKNKYYDFAKSSEWKAKKGHKDDIPRKGDQIHNRQTSPVSWEESVKGGKTLHAYDFDDTIARVKANIRTTITSPSGDYNKEILIPAENFPEESKALEARLGNLEINYDFSEFEKQINDAIVNSKVISKLQKSLSNPQVKTTILTARSIGHPVTKYLKSIGLDAYVVPLGLQVKGKVTGQDKANWIENHINKGYNTIYFIDDSEENRVAVAALKDKYPDISLTVEDPAAVSEMMMGMMSEPEKKKHNKAMKRLSKDLKKINKGDQYVKVPKSAQGTLTRKLYETKLFSQGWWKNIINEVLLTEGGAAGHMNHPFDDRDLTFAEMKELVRLSLQGRLNIEADVTEKTDGQNLAVTFKNGKVGAARNKATIREPMDIDAVASKFEGRGDIEKAFTLSMKDLENALAKNLSPETLNNIFQNGKRFLNIEIIYPATKNVITYGPKAYIQFHGVDEYNLETATKGKSFPEFAPKLQKLIADVNANIQQTFEIIPPKIITTKAVRDFDKKESSYINKINVLQKEFNLQDSDEVVMYHQKWWEKKVNEEFPRALDGEKFSLVRRWAYFDKSFRLRKIQDEETRQKAIDFDKTNFQQQNKENVYQFEKIFLELGTDVLSNIDNYLAVNPKESVKELRRDIQNVIKQIQSSNDLEVLNKLKYQLRRIEDMGGFDKLVPSEGIVFIYKGKTYKLTGLFAAVNQLLGLTKYV